MWYEWKRATLQNGRYIITVSLIAITGGALLWYERNDPRYPTQRDIAEVRFGFLERAVALDARPEVSALRPYADAAFKTNFAGPYPYVQWTPYVDALVPDHFYRPGFINFVSTPEAELTGLTGAADVGDVIRDRKMYLTYDAINNRLGITNITVNTKLMLDAIYMSTNLLHEYGKLYSAMKWTESQTHRGWIAPEPNPEDNEYFSLVPRQFTWTGYAEGYTKNPKSLLPDAVASCSAAAQYPVPKLGDGDPPTASVWQALDYPLETHSYRVRWGLYTKRVQVLDNYPEDYNYKYFVVTNTAGTPLVWVECTEACDYASSSDAQAVPPMTNCTAIDARAFTHVKMAWGPEAPETYLHQWAPYESVVVTNYELITANDGLKVAHPALNSFFGRFSEGAVISKASNHDLDWGDAAQEFEYKYGYLPGWEPGTPMYFPSDDGPTLMGQATFGWYLHVSGYQILYEWRFQCLSDRAQFWP